MWQSSGSPASHTSSIFVPVPSPFQLEKHSEACDSSMDLLTLSSPLPRALFCLLVLDITCVQHPYSITRVRAHPGIPDSRSCPLPASSGILSQLKLHRSKLRLPIFPVNWPHLESFQQMASPFFQVLRPSGSPRHLVFPPKPYPNPPADPAPTPCQKTTKNPTKFHWLLTSPNPLLSIT